MHTASLFVPEIHSAFEAARKLPRWRRGWAVMQPCRSVMLRHAWQVMVFCVAICVVLWLLRPGVSLWGQLAYSLPMGLIAWLLIESGRFFIDQDSPHLFPRGWRGGVLILGGVFTGFALGTWIGDMANGYSSFTLMRRAPEFFIYIFLFSTASGVGIAVFFYAQGKSAYLQAELEAQKRQAVDAQLKLLQSQLDPHMLFNTLANLRVLIQSDPDRAVQMLDQMNDFLRATLAASRATEHSLQAEFDRLRDYLALMQIRMGARLDFSLDLQPEMAHVQVPALILQSLVENAIVHGLEPKVQGGHITIRASQEAQQLLLQVADDGLGFDSTQMQEGFGLAQVRERLQSRYGAQHTIELIANYLYVAGGEALKSFKKPGTNSPSEGSASGCTVIIKIPLPA
jgi:hypothetical protein